MKLSKESQYGLMGLAYLAQQPPGTILQLSQVAEAVGLPQMFLAKIFRKLTVHGILRSFRGKERGYSLAKLAREIRIKEIVEAIEGPEVFERCIFWSNHCSDENPCMLHDVWREARPKVWDLMANLSLAEVAADRSKLHTSRTTRRRARSSKPA